jgi:hypothetical protein
VVNSSYLNFYNYKEKKFLNSGKIKTRVLPPVETKGMTAESVGELAEKLHRMMQREFDQLNKEIGLEEKYYSEEYAKLPESKLPRKKSD